jgi:hypothetical protein
MNPWLHARDMTTRMWLLTAFLVLAQRMRSGRNMRNAVLLLRRLCGVPPLRAGAPLNAAALSEMVLGMVLAGPLRSLHLAIEDVPPALLQSLDSFVQRVMTARGTKATAAPDEAERLLHAAKNDAQLCRHVSGWCLKFLFEGSAVSQNASGFDCSAVA